MAKVMIVLAALILGVFSRWLPHPPNFTPVIAIAIFMAMRLQKTWWVAIVPILIMFISDSLLGFHSLAPFTYSALGFLALAVHFLPNSGVWGSSGFKVVTTSLMGSIWFFLASNTAVWWMTSLYPKNINGLMLSYVAGIPFFHNTLISTVLFTGLLVALDKWIQRQVTADFVKA